MLNPNEIAVVGAHVCTHPLAASLSNTVLVNASPIGYQSLVIQEQVPSRDASDLALLLE